MLGAIKQKILAKFEVNYTIYRMMTKRMVWLGTWCLLLLGAMWTCERPPAVSSAVPSQAERVEQRARDFFATFAARTDWEKLCSFYRNDLVFEDVLLQIHLDSLWKFKRFYRWDEEADRFRKLSPEQAHLTVTSLVVDDSTAVARGRVNPFYYDGYLIDTDWGMDFTIWLYFDDNLQIKRQIDWFEYAPEVLESILKRYRTKGVEAIPDWLDLSLPE
jgi:hypothetical protein